METPTTGPPSGKRALPDEPQCPDPEEIGAFIDRQLSEDELNRIEEHLDECRHCFSVYADSVRNLFPEEPEDYPQRLQRHPMVRTKAVRFMAAAAALLVLAINFQRMSAWVYDKLGSYYYQKGAKTVARIDPYELVRFQMPLPVEEDTIDGRERLRGPADGDPPPPVDGLAMQRAKRFFEIARRKNPDNPQPYIHLLSAMILTGDYSDLDMVIQSVGKMRQEPALLSAAVVLARYLACPKEDSLERENALRDMERLFLENPDSAPIAYNLGRIYSEMRQKEKARSVWAAYLELEPEGPFADWLRPGLD